MAWDIPPLVASPNSGSNDEGWKTRSCKIITPQRIGTILLLSNHDDEDEQQQQQQDSSILESELSGHDDDVDPDSPGDLVGADSFHVLPPNGPVGGGSSPSQSLSTRKLADTTPSCCACPPLIWKFEYILVPLITGKIQMYRLYDEPVVVASTSTTTTTTTATSPLHSTSTTIITSPISTLTLPSEDVTIVAMKEMTNEDSILVLAGEGHVYHIQVEEHTGVLVLEQSWDTGSCGASCLTVLPKDDNHHQQYYILIGYSTGQIECYTWQRGHPPPPRGGGGGRGKRPKPSCCWKGWMDEWYAIESMQILSCPTSSFPTTTTTPPLTQQESVKNETKDPKDDPVDSDIGKETPTTTTTTTSSAIHEKSNFPILLVTLQSSIGDDNPPMIQALDLNAIHSHATAAAASSTSPPQRSINTTSEEDDDFLVLETFRLLPDPAMGIIESSSSSSHVSLPPPHHKLYAGNVPSQGTNQVLPLAGKKCGVALSNGTIAILSPGWGVENDNDQLVLSYPAIGMGTLYWKEREYLVCCLRAGTCYLIPTTSNTTTTTTHVHGDDPSEIPVALYPHDVDADTTHVYVQSFTAGSLRIPGHPTMTLPVLVYVFPGGVIDIYSCHLLAPPCSIGTNISSSQQQQQKPPSPLPSEEDQVLDAMIQEGCLDMVLQILDRNVAIDDHDALWNDAKQEWQTLAANQTEYRSDMSSPLQTLNELPALRNLLLQLSSRTTS